MCRVNASARLNDLISPWRLQYSHSTLCFTRLWIVSSCRVRSYGRLKTMLHGCPVCLLTRVHLCGPVSAFLAEIAAAGRACPTGSVGSVFSAVGGDVDPTDATSRSGDDGDSVAFEWSGDVIGCTDLVRGRCLDISSENFMRLVGGCISCDDGMAVPSLIDDSIDTRLVGNSGVVSGPLAFGCPLLVKDGACLNCCDRRCCCTPGWPCNLSDDVAPGLECVARW